MNKCEQYCQTIKRMAVTSSSPILPPEYQQVEYLQSVDDINDMSTNIHIDTGVTYFADFEIKCQNATNIGNATCGCGGVGAFYGATLCRESDSRPNYAFYATSSSHYVSSIPMTTGGIFAWRGNSLYVNGDYVAQLAKETTTNEFRLYGCTNHYYHAVRIFYCKLWDNSGNLIRHYIPCYRKSDNKPGMYDIVNSTFDAGTGTSGYFIVGNNV